MWATEAINPLKPLKPHENDIKAEDYLLEINELYSQTQKILCWQKKLEHLFELVLRWATLCPSYSFQSFEC